MIRLTFRGEYRNPDDLIAALEEVTRLLDEGYTSGVDPSWDLTGEEEEAFVVGDVVGWTLSDGGQDNGEYEVIEVTGSDLVLKNEHGNTFTAKAHQCWTEDD